MSAEPIAAVARRMRRLRLLVEGPEDAWLMCRMGTWAAVLPLLKRFVRLDTLARLMWTAPDHQARPDVGKIVALSALLAGRAGMSHGTCYERSLLAYRFLAQRGADPRLVVALKQDGDAMTAHAWVAIGGAPVGESESIEDFVPVAVYGRGGRREE
jgi:hypothetical protein